jgi:Plasmid pRiA4b ORF-3-like protein
MNRDPQQSVTYQLRIVLRDFSPLIWRRLHVPSNIDLARLRRILQILFSWGGEHLRRFHIHGKDYGGISFDHDPRQARLSDFHLHRCERFLYQYDFIAGWELEIRLENILPFDPARSYPVCIGGKKAGPPEHLPEPGPTSNSWTDTHLSLRLKS